MASILLIDDDESMRLLTAELLRADGHTVDTADGGITGLALCEAALPDLVITDIIMPGMSGLELIKELRKTAPRPRVIAISGGSEFSRSIYLPFAKDLGVDRILAKPVLPDVLLQTVADVLARPLRSPETRARQ
jgi:CheY-like chemotaxis protein